MATGSIPRNSQSDREQNADEAEQAPSLSSPIDHFGRAHEPEL